MRSFARIPLCGLLVFTLFLGIFTPALAGTTGSISGSIVDSSSKAPVGGAKITASSPSATRTTTANASGFFTLLGLPPDTYTVSVDVKNYEPQNITGVNVFADQVATVNVPVVKSLVTIAKVSSRSTSSAYQPSHPHDTYTVTSRDIAESQGTALNDSATQLFSSLPGVTNAGSNGGVPVVRGGRANTIGYTLQGAPTTNAYNSTFGAANGQDTTFNFDVNDNVPTLALQELQLTPGVADASYGDAGTGNINLVFKQGAYPAFADTTVGVGGNGFQHALASEWGMASPNGRLSGYFMFHGQNTYANWGNGADASKVNALGFPGLVSDRTFLGNVGYKFGKNNKYALSFFTLNAAEVADDDFGINYNDICVNTCAWAATDSSPGTWAGCRYFYTDWYKGMDGPLGSAAGAPTPTEVLGIQYRYSLPYCQALISPQNGQNRLELNQSLKTAGLPYQAQNNPHFNEELTFTDNLASNAFLTVKAYHTGGYQNNDRSDRGGGDGGPYYWAKGGYQKGFSADLNLQVNDKNLVGIGAGTEYQHPDNTLLYSLWTTEILTAQNFFYGPYDFIPQNYGNTGVCGANYTYEALHGLSWMPSANFCGYLPNALGTPNSPVQIPGNSVRTFLHPSFSNFYLKDTFRPTEDVTVDLGVRVDHAAYGLPKPGIDLATCTTLYMPLTYSPPTDANGNYVSVVPGKQCQNATFASIDKANNPTITQPRVGVSWKVNGDNAVKAAFGRSFSWAPYGQMDPGATTDDLLPQAANIASYFNPAIYCYDNISFNDWQGSLGRAATDPRWGGRSALPDPNCQSQAAFNAAFTPGKSVPFYSYYNPFPCQGTLSYSTVNGLKTGSCSSDPNWPLPPNGQPNPTGAPYCGLAPILSPCTSYEEQQVWENRNDFAGANHYKPGLLQPVAPSQYSNYEVGWNHDFANGVGPKWLKEITSGTGLALTFWKRNGFDETMQESLPIPWLTPAPGQPQAQYSGVSTNNGRSYANGIEMRLTRRRQYGLSAQFSASYQRALTNVPQSGLYSTLYQPSVSGAAVTLDNLYPVAYVSPLTTNTTLAYNTKNGWHLGVQTAWAIGYPVGAGLYSADYINGVATMVPSTNGHTGPNGATQFLDPANPGSMLNPSIAATTGTKESFAAFGRHSPPQSFTNLQIAKDISQKLVLGLNVNNVFGYTNSGAVLSNDYQPVATGISGPLSGSHLSAAGTPAFSASSPYVNYGNMLGRTYYLYLTVKGL